MKHFSEYLKANGKLDTPKVDPSADTGPSGTKTPEATATKGKGWEATVKSTDKPKPYGNNTKPVKADFSDHPKGEKNDKGFAKDGDKKLVYEPKTPKDFGKEGGTKKTTWPKTTKEFLDTTKEMTLSEFAEFIADRNKISNNMPPASADPIMAANYVSALANANNGIMESIVREMKRLGCLDRLLAELFKHPETYAEIANIISENVVASRRLDRAISDAKMQEVVDATAEETEDDGKHKARKNPKTIGGPKNKLDMSGSDIVTTK